MRYEEFVSQVQAEADLQSSEEAVRIVTATLSTLGERLEETELKRLAAQVPHELKSVIFGRRDTPYTYDLEEFYNRVSARADIGYPQAVRQARCVMKVLSGAVSKGEFDDVLARLPDQYRELFGDEPEGPLSPTTSSPEFREGFEQGQ